ncbi:hypothetical protein ACK3SF_01765 [Candidatus Nanosalina sp. VS9-1]|uniref:COG1470 family protein n=1 Tax=Candidatus Nanosalina sp. VS9-1 TaxID=3388566 RepID=UPI0039E08C75
MRKAALILAFLAMIFTASAFTASMEPVDREASPGEQAVFNVTVFNNASEERRFVLDYEFSRSGWIYFDNSRRIPAGESRDFRVTISPGEDALQQSYSFKIFVTDFKTDETKVLSDYMRVNRDYRMNVPDFNVNKESFLPGETVEASITVQNILPRIVDDYSISSSFDGEQRDVDTDPLAPGALKTYSFEYDISQEASPGSRNISIKLVQDGEERVFSRLVQVEEVRKINRSGEMDDRVLIVTGSRNVENNGNSVANLSENITFPSYLDPILDLDPAPSRTVKEEDSNTYIWDFQLQPGEEMTFSYQVNYWIPLALAAIIILGLAVLGRLTGSFKISKEVEELDEDLKVSLEIVNDTEGFKPQVTIRDYVPNAAQLQEEFEMAKPEIRKTTDGVEMEWTLEDFKPGERRVIQYRVTPKVEVEDGMELPEAEVIEDGETVAQSKKR